MELINPVVRNWQRRAAEDPDAFWSAAAEQLPWFRRWERVLDWTPPTFRWFSGAQTNLSYNCLDHHVAHGRGGQAALVAENERGERRVYTYAQLLEQVKRLAAALRGLGIERGDRVAIYMPTCPEAIALMLAVTRIGAIHLVVFAGFGSGALAERLRLSGARALFYTDLTFRKGKDVPLAGIVEDALEQAGATVERVVVLRRGNDPGSSRPGRD
ncbi:MAG: AMP-binding protein, partial [Chloroflexota bacterium]|nr:AMP-binding protein [Chloroflexota bacterium]